MIRYIHKSIREQTVPESRRRDATSGAARRVCAATPTTSCAACAPSRASWAARCRYPAPRRDVSHATLIFDGIC